jgi:catechol 2,3-dioxygenase-like lactoylglutathione lyase family enzyme
VVLTGAHSIIYSTNPEADRAFFRDVLGLPIVDVGHGWLIFGPPPSEVAVHPSAENGRHEFYLMCADIEAFVGKMKVASVACGPIQDQGWPPHARITSRRRRAGRLSAEACTAASQGLTIQPNAWEPR